MSSGSECENSGSEKDGDNEAPAEKKSASWEDLKLSQALCDVCRRLKWPKPTEIQKETIPLALAGKDVVGLAETGSGKTAAFALPIIERLLEKPQRMFALVLAPTRELALQISEQFTAIGRGVGLLVGTLVGGVDLMQQSIVLAKRPHIIVGTPGRIIDHLENTKGFSLHTVKFFVLDEADKMLGSDFEQVLSKLLATLSRPRTSLLFSATMTKNVSKLQNASLVDPIKVSVSSKYRTVNTLEQYYMFIPAKLKDVYLVNLLSESGADTSCIIFVETCVAVERTSLMLRHLGFPSVPLSGDMKQERRIQALNKFRAKQRSILVATNVASRGLDIPHVDLVVNYDIPSESKAYIHRVGRTARAGRAGKSISLVTQYDVEMYQRIEHALGKKLPEYPSYIEDIKTLTDRVMDAVRLAKADMSDIQKNKRLMTKRKRNDDGNREHDPKASKKRFHQAVSNNKKAFTKKL